MNRRDRFGEPVADQVPTATTPVHDPACVNGYIGEDSDRRPIPCPTCKPWLVACPTCGTASSRCEFGRSLLRGRCCPQCPHVPPTRKTRRTKSDDQEASA